MKRRGGGSIFRRGGALWLKYYRDGQPMRESVAKTLGKLAADVTEKDARALLNKRMGAIAGGEQPAPRAERVVVKELLDDLITEYTVNNRRSIERVQDAVAHLTDFFAPARAQSLSTARIREYIARRQAPRKTADGSEVPGATNATINRELAALKRAYTLAVQGRKILTRPHIPMLVENNARQGFFEREQLEAVQRHLPEALRPAAAFAYITGWRRSEVMSLTWAQVDFGAGLVRLEPGTTKNRAGRMFPSRLSFGRCWRRSEPTRRSSAASADGSSRPSSTATGCRSSPSGGHGARPVRRPACPGGYFMTSGGQQSATWSARACRAAWPCRWSATRPRQSTGATRSSTICTPQPSSWRPYRRRRNPRWAQ